MSTSLIYAMHIVIILLSIEVFRMQKLKALELEITFSDAQKYWTKQFFGK